jgi:D-alanyl-D-alanine carboxypeptidase/D-alanyl-D-alanine-endopeptidase (penicillin-binding protein 4)
MSRVLKIFFIVLALAFSNINYATGIAQDDNNLYLEIEDLLKKSGEKDLNAGIYIKNLTDGSVKFSYHPERFFVPASVVKIFTAYEALSYFGPDYKIRTSLLSNGSMPKNGVLKSDVYIKFSGNPSFTYQDLKTMFENLQVKEITGDIVIDGTMFDDLHAAPGGFTWDDNNFYYAAPSSAIIINKNVSEAMMRPSSATGSMANLSIEDPAILAIENKVTTALSNKQDCPYKSKYLGGNKYEVYGCMPISKDPQSQIKLKFSLQDNNLMAQNYIQKVLNELHINLRGTIRFSKVKPGFKKISIHYSPSLAAILKETIEDSCNLSASSIFKHIVARYTKEQAGDEKAEIVMRVLLKTAGLENYFIIKDGAGASHYNLVTPKAVVRLLEIAYKDPKTSEAFIEALAIYGSEGTLKSRNLGKKFNKYTYGKTGTTRRSSSLAGYYLPETGHQYAFAILINHYTVSLDKIKSLEDKILHTLLSKTAQQK